ncbi:hypothetical protein SDC9_147341 [bioreactor metagenome]|uniref:Uncharacterized protein n=1 Tax=bioreactor metagenome TaxID=1076179 RepID=A0A645EEF4_9ZZZZ
MTREELATHVDEYLADHLDRSFWQGLDGETRSASVSMALVDVLAELPGLSLETMTATGFAAKAIAEQAVFLARNYANINEGKVVTAEGVAGVSTTYTLIGGSPGLSFRAISFIGQAKRSILGGTVRVSRG